MTIDEAFEIALRETGESDPTIEATRKIVQFNYPSIPRKSNPIAPGHEREAIESIKAMIIQLNKSPSLRNQVIAFAETIYRNKAEEN